MPSTRRWLNALYNVTRIFLRAARLSGPREPEWINPVAMLRGGVKCSLGNAEGIPLERRHNVLRAEPGLIRKCLTLVKPGLDCPDIPLHDTPGNPYQTTTIATPAVATLCDHSHEYILICVDYATSVVSFVV